MGRLTLLGAGRVAPAGGPADATETTEFLARTTGLTPTETQGYKDLINGLVADGVFRGVMDAMYVFATNTEATSFLNLIGTTYPLTKVGSPAFTPDSGWTSAGSARLDTGFNQTTAPSPNMVSGSASAWAWALNTFSSGTDYGTIITGNINDTFRIYPHYSDNTFYYACNDGGFPSFGAQTSPFFGINRTGTSGADSRAYQNTTASAGTSGSAETIQSQSLRLMNDGGGGAAFTGRLSFVAFGKSLNSTQITALYNRVHTYMQNVAGAP